MPYFSNLQQLLTGLVLSYSGYRLALHPDGFISSLAPLARLVEPRWASVQGALGQEVRHEGELSGVCLLAVGYFYLWSMYTQDEKFKRNSVPGRFILAFASYYLATIGGSKPSATASPIVTIALLKLFAIFNLASGLLMGLSIGFQDGNQVDLDETERARRRDRQWKTRERELLAKIESLATTSAPSKE
ncbi:hypothetical protein JCM3766R1_002075 [Sporobolomyces carnicolor]